MHKQKTPPPIYLSSSASAFAASGPCSSPVAAKSEAEDAWRALLLTQKILKDTKKLKNKNHHVFIYLHRLPHPLEMPSCSAGWQRLPHAMTALHERLL